MVDILQHLNDIATVLALLISGVVARYQIKHYKSQHPNLEINSVENSEYSPGTEGDYGLEKCTQERAEFEAEFTIYEIKIEIGNRGMESATIKDVELNIDENEDQVEITNRHNRISGTEVKSYDYVSIFGKGKGRLLETYPEELKAKLKVRTSSSDLENEIILERNYAPRNLLERE